MRLCLCMWGRGGGLLPTPTWNEKHSHLTDFIIWESSSPGNDSHLEDFNTCKVFSIANDSYSRIFLIWYTDPAKPAKCQSVNANVNHYHLDYRYLVHILQSSESTLGRCKKHLVSSENHLESSEKLLESSEKTMWISLLRYIYIFIETYMLNTF